MRNCQVPRMLILIFCAAQLLGELCYFLFVGMGSTVMWNISLILLMPGNMTASFLVESLAWGHLSLPQMMYLSIPLEIIINFCAWFLVYRMFRAVVKSKA
jgi:hypothetical protein